jgi:hypothetical protein
VKRCSTCACPTVGTNPDAPDTIDIAGMVGLYDFRRLRRTANWMLLRSVSCNDDGTVRQDERIPIDPDVSGRDGLPVIGGFCANLPEIREVTIGAGKQFELCEGPVGHTAAFTCVFGTYDRRFACGYRDEVNQFGEHPSLLFTPSELLIADLFVHRDLPFELPPEPTLYSGLFSGVDARGARGDAQSMPLLETMHELGGPPIVATPHIPRYPKLVQTVCDQLEWDVKEFRGYRFLMAYPPIPTVLVMQYPLPQRPK